MGQQLQQQLKEMSVASREVAQVRKQLEILQDELAQQKVQLQYQERVNQEQEQKIINERKDIEIAKLQLDNEHKKLIEERISLNRTQDEVRQNELKLSQSLKGWSEQGIPIQFVTKDNNFMEYSKPSNVQKRRPRGSKARGRNTIKKLLLLLKEQENCDSYISDQKEFLKFISQDGKDDDMN
eukprot:TRINITY_DN35554_c0_g1_i1.p2 TRINITY_DN35554_c0_g1~~TRINITY_DN35554_c0_g1_i1.p2  ORF type:complete len:182 (-),score=27.39 TRINITY_DN35554_c0_g1_i1:171-716(-)